MRWSNIGSAGGNHLPILYNMFPDLIWLLYDPAPFSKEVMKHPTKDKSVFVFNMYFTDQTLNHVKQHCQGRKILFISDIRVEAKEEDIIKDMRNQSYWGMELNSPLMLLKFRLPYEELESIPKSNKQLRLTHKLLHNPDFGTNKRPPHGLPQGRHLPADLPACQQLGTAAVGGAD